MDSGLSKNHAIVLWNLLPHFSLFSLNVWIQKIESYFLQESTFSYTSWRLVIYFFEIFFAEFCLSCWSGNYHSLWIDIYIIYIFSKRKKVRFEEWNSKKLVAVNVVNSALEKQKEYFPLVYSRRKQRACIACGRSFF